MSAFGVISTNAHWPANKPNLPNVLLSRSKVRRGVRQELRNRSIEAAIMAANGGMLQLKIPGNTSTDVLDAPRSSFS